jgi:Spy/CpxP family protein refolding chaperone
MKRAIKIAAGIGAALTLVLAATAANSFPVGMGPGHGPMGDGPMAHGMGPGARGNPVAAAEARLAALKLELNITTNQDAAWKAFADQTKAQAEAMQAFMTSLQSSTAATAPERLDQRNLIMKKRLEQMEKTAVLFKELYAVLTVEQKALADQRFGMMHGRGPGFNRPAK